MAASISNRLPSDVQSRKAKQKPALQKGKGKENILKSTPTPFHPELWEGDIRDHDTPLDWTSLTDPSSSRIPPVFTKNGNYFFSLVGSSVKIYSLATGQIVSTLTAPASTEQTGSSDVLTSAVVNPHNALQLITGTLDGRILIWDFVNSTLLQTIDVGQPIHFMCTHEQFKSSVFVAASRPGTKPTAGDKNAVVLQISLKQSEYTSQPTEIIPVGKTRFPTGLAVSPNGAWLVATAAHKVYVAKTADLSAGFTKYVSSDRLTCLAFHPFEEYFATGDDKGVVRIWYCLNDNLAVNVRGVEKRTQTRSLHWHAHAVSSVAFTPNGAYLLSGGEESVLVIWQLHTGKKEFVPRLSAPISTISVSKSSSDEEEYLLGLTDATYIFVSSSSLKVTRSYSRIKVDPTMPYGSSSKQTFVPIAVHPLTSTLVLPSSHPSFLQIYSPFFSTLLSELEVSPSNRVSRRDEKPVIPSSVEIVVISSSGFWMATVDYRGSDGGFRPDVYLKIWCWNIKEESWLLNTRIDRPHGTEKVTDIRFSPDVQETGYPMLVSVGEDSRIKVWRLLKTGLETGIWASHATLDFHSEIARSVSWAPDSSLFAVAVGSHVALYDPLTTAVRHIFTAPDGQALESAHFIGLHGRYILASGRKSLVVWDLIDTRVAWQTITPLQINNIIPHPRNATFAVIHSPSIKDEGQVTKVSIFHISSKIPSSVHTIPFTLRNVIYATLRISPGFTLVGVTYTWRVVIIGESAQPFKDKGLAAKGINFECRPQRRTLFQDIFGASAFSAETYDILEAPSLQCKKAESYALFSVPAFITPSLDTFFDPLVKSFLTIRLAGDDRDVDPANSVDEDDVMEEDDELPISANQKSRLPDSGELQAFTKLFRTCCTTGRGPTLPAPHVNGKVNGIKPEINGPSWHPATKPAPVLTGPVLSVPSDPTPNLLPTTVGKKRKKTSS